MALTRRTKVELGTLLANFCDQLKMKFSGKNICGWIYQLV